MSKVSKEMVDAVRLARWEEWEGMAKQLPRGQHILSVELLRINPRQTAVVLTVIDHGKLVQYELRADASGANPVPVISNHRDTSCEPALPRSAALAAMDPRAGTESPVANGVAIGDPPPKEEPRPGAVALGTSLLSTTFNLGEQAVAPDSTK